MESKFSFHFSTLEFLFTPLYGKLHHADKETIICTIHYPSNLPNIVLAKATKYDYAHIIIIKYMVLTEFNSVQ